METVIDLALRFWQYSLLIALILIGFLINLLDRRIKINHKFEYDVYPVLIPIKIPTKGKGFWTMIKIWLLGKRHWQFHEDFKFKLNGEAYVIPRGFSCDGASIPKALSPFLSSTGLLLVAGVCHDYLYQHQTLLKADKKKTMGIVNQKTADQIFLDINLQINGFYLINKLAYWSLRGVGFVAWNKHRKAEKTK